MIKRPRRQEQSDSSDFSQNEPSQWAHSVQNPSQQNESNLPESVNSKEQTNNLKLEKPSTSTSNTTIKIEQPIQKKIKLDDLTVIDEKFHPSKDFKFS